MYVTVETEQGVLRGQQKTSDYFSHKKYFSFQGIPFVKPPVGPLRFKDPVEPEAWTGVRDALKEGSDCPQFELFTGGLIGSEDCLFLNVYTPQLDGDRKLPVMVWIHGGGFVGGTGSTELYGPEYLIEHDVIIVTINYRLGPLGVSHGEDLSCRFPHILKGLIKPTTEELEFIAKVAKMWATFAKTGDPTYSGMEVTWKPSKRNSFYHLDIGKEFKLVPDRVKQNRTVMWQQLCNKY